MGQKVDARVFREGVNKKNWEFKYIEKNKEDSSLFLYKTLEIQKYLNRFFGLYKIKIHNCKIFYSDSSLQIFISFYVTTRTFYAISKNITKYSKKCTAVFKPAFSNRHKKVKSHRLRKIVMKSVKAYAENKSKNQNYNSERVILNKRKIQNSPNRVRKIRNFEIKKNQKVLIKKNVFSMKLNKYSVINLKEFHQILMKSLKIYTKNRVSVSITLQNLNRFKNLSKIQMKGLKQIFKQLRNFVKNSFFKEAINILFVNISKRKSAKILAEFMSDQFRLNQLRTDQVTISRKDNYFLGFLKQVIMLLIKSEISCVMGVKIIVKGRFNRAPRARINHIRFGKFSLQSFNSKINYHQSTAYTVNGTFGIKV